MTGLRTAVAFLTVFPARGEEWEPRRSVAWYPVVGLVLAACVGGLAAALYGWLPPLLAASLSVAVWVLLTGGLHLDGLADTADAAFAPVTRERRIEILADVHHGTFAVVAVVLALLLKAAAVNSLGRQEAAAAVALAIVAARCLLPLVIHAFPAARPGGMGAGVQAGATPLIASFGAVVGLAAALLIVGWSGAAVVAGLGLGALATGAWLSGRLGGLNGDAYGAVVEMVETATLMIAAALFTNDHATPFPFEVMP